ncbi:MAG: TAT-variant-translocated molybdopterin oxidoreductase [Bdellovibrionales bacterium]|nr:TAT-variant-translocated molybdopterin oxidoreductase [Bdellovibrionales bacterium]
METQNTQTPKYWMSLEQWRQDPEFQKLAEKEFQSSPLQSDDGKDGWARREFLKLMGASLALTSFGCVRRTAQKIIPYVNKPADVIHGLSNYYASSFADGFEGLGLLVTTRDGRPIKIEGNPDHPANRGGMSTRGHAMILKLYDPDRYTGPKRNLQNDTRSNREIVGVKWEDLDKAVIEQLKKGSIAILGNSCLSPSTQALTDDFSAAYGAKSYRYDDVSYEPLQEATQKSYGQAGLPRYDFEKAKYVVAINNDFMGTWLNPTLYSRQFALRRRKTADMNKLVVFESLMSLTGSNADERYRIRPSQTLDLVMAILNELLINKKVSRFAGDAAVLRAVSAFAKADVGVNVADVAAELWKNRGQSLVVAGGVHSGIENAAHIHVAVNLLNAVLENDGKTVEPVGAAVVKPASANISDLIASMNKKEVKTLIIHGCNPMYSLPAAAKFREAFNNVEMIIYTGDRNDETARYADYVASDHHSLENWGDMLSLDGTYSIQQPTIQPLYNTRAMQDSLLVWAKASSKASARVKGAEDWYAYLRNNWKDLGRGKASTDDGWTELLRSGVLSGVTAGGGSRTFLTAALNEIKPASRKSGFELAMYETVALGGGDLANVPWLQELPDPITKITWDNYATISPKDAASLKLKEGYHVTLTVGDQKITIPAHIQPGQADGVVGLAVGYGRVGAGKVADGVGQNAFALAQWSNGSRVTSGIETAVAVSGGRTELACTQGHHSMEGRQIVVEETLKDFIKNPGGTVHRHKMFSMWSGHKYKGNKWGMVIDLNTCNGCSACVIACQSENNIPTVGKKYVIEGREMQWLRIDRYYVGDPENPDVVHQPLPCMHCDNAPCETVCPVIATSHSDEGTNDMTYNRCVGTRYCSNNCPYKVRRFNWFQYSEGIPTPHKMAMNPDVTVRFRGVMEKCTFCIHRIRNSKSEAKVQNRTLRPNEVQTACQQSCVTGAITFGDLNNTEWAVTKEFTSPSSYALLEELNTQPAVRYQVKVRNTEELKGAPKHHGEGHHA